MRVRFADNSTHRVPDGVTDEQMVMPADILPTSYEVGLLAGSVRPGDVVAIVGAGPNRVGLIAREPPNRHQSDDPHRYTMDEFETAYDTFGRASETGALKVHSLMVDYDSAGVWQIITGTAQCARRFSPVEPRVAPVTRFRPRLPTTTNCESAA